MGDGDLTQKERDAVDSLDRNDGNLSDAARELDTSPQSVRSSADRASRKTGRKDYYDKDS